MAVAAEKDQGMGRRSLLKKTLRLFLPLIICVLLFCQICNSYVNSFSSDFIKDDLSQLPAIKTGLLPGTSKYFAKNERNTFYQSRVNSTFLLYKIRDLDKIIVSGTAERFYNEPEQLKKDLKNSGVPDSIIVTDPSGVHTLESVLYLKKMKIDSVIIISQYNHLQRAVFLARKSGIVAFGYAAADPVEEHRKVKVREYFAKVKAVFDSWISL